MKTIQDLHDALVAANADDDVWFDFASTHPTTIESWRGRYDEPALGWSNEGIISVTELLENIDDALIKIHEGYKGGSYEYRLSDGLWVDNYGEYSTTIICGFVHQDGALIIKTTRDYDDQY